jgi:hypothetical protein
LKTKPVKRPPGPARTRTPISTRQGCTAAALFDALWNTLAEVIGPTAAATLLQRSLKRAVLLRPEVADVVIRRDGFAYTYTVPTFWSEERDDAVAGLRHVVRELWPLLTELTGSVVVRRLREVAMLTECGVLPEDAAS